MTDTSKGDDYRVPVELWNRKACISQCIGVDSVLQFMREVILIWWRRNLTKGLRKLLNQTSSASKQLKVTGKFIWDAY